MVKPEPFEKRKTTLRQRDSYFAGAFFAMGCPCEVLIETDDVDTARHLLGLVRGEAWRIEAKWSRYLPTSQVQRINSAPALTHTLDEETCRLLDYCVQLTQLSEGAFDITSGVLRKVWTFDGGNKTPSLDRVAEALNDVGWHKVLWQSPNLQLKEDMQIDFGGVGKEYAVDTCCNLLRQHSPASCLVNFGGDCAVTSAPTKQTSWFVGIDSSHTPGTPVTTIPLAQGALATSGDAHRFVWRDGKKLSHILDARTGQPVAGAPASLTVNAETCLDAGMLATLASMWGTEAESVLDDEKVTYWVQRS